MPAAFCRPFTTVSVHTMPLDTPLLLLYTAPLCRFWVLVLRHRFTCHGLPPPAVLTTLPLLTHCRFSFHCTRRTPPALPAVLHCFYQDCTAPPPFCSPAPVLLTNISWTTPRCRQNKRGLRALSHFRAPHNHDTTTRFWVGRTYHATLTLCVSRIHSCA